MALTKHQAGELFKPYADGIWKAVVDLGFERYKKSPFRSTHRAGTAASTIHDLMVAGTREVFVDEPKVRFIELRGTDITLMEIEEEALVWFKKLDGGRRARGNDTIHSRKLMRGECPDLPGIRPAATPLIVGYAPNAENTRVSRVSIVRPSPVAVSPEWFLDLSRPAGGSLLIMSGGPAESGDRGGSKITIIGGDQQSKLIN